jgi:hypothetical protein
MPTAAEASQRGANPVRIRPKRSATCRQQFRTP